jgi:hypothetical protein
MQNFTQLDNKYEQYRQKLTYALVQRMVSTKPIPIKLIVLSQVFVDVSVLNFIQIGHKLLSAQATFHLCPYIKHSFHGTKVHYTQNCPMKLYGDINSTATKLIKHCGQYR